MSESSAMRIRGDEREGLHAMNRVYWGDPRARSDLSARYLRREEGQRSPPHMYQFPGLFCHPSKPPDWRPNGERGASGHVSAFRFSALGEQDRTSMQGASRQR